MNLHPHLPENRCLVPFLLIAGCAFLVTCERSPSPPPAAALPVVTTTEPSKVAWMDPKKIERGPLRRISLSDLQMQRIVKLQSVFADVDASDVDAWADDFKRDEDPDRELDVWERMAAAYTAYTTRHQLSIDAKKDVFQIVLLRSGASEAETLSHLHLKILSTQDAIDVMHGSDPLAHPVAIRQAPAPPPGK
jgi:hypothetical protein